MDITKGGKSVNEKLQEARNRAYEELDRYVGENAEEPRKEDVIDLLHYFIDILEMVGK